LLIVLSLFTSCVFLMGYGPASLARGKGAPLEQIALAVAVGILINYCLMLTGFTMTTVLIAGMTVALWGFFKLCGDLRIRLADGVPANRTTIFSVCCISYILIIYYLTIFAEPLSSWDARSIWFFHARMIWAEGALRQSAGWNHPSLAFSNPDYPKLVPAIAAQLGYLKGYWNEFLPKGSLFVMLIPLVLWVSSFARKSLSFILLVLIFFRLDAWLWNGTMDGYLVFYSGVALLLFGRYLSERRNVDLYSAMCALGIAANLKNEGVLFALCVMAALLVINRGSPAFGLVDFATRIRTDSVFASVLLFSMAPTLMWTICKNAWGLHNDLAVNPSGGFLRLMNRLFDGFSAQYVLHFLILRAGTVWLVIGLVAITLAFSRRQKLRLHRGALIAATTSALYICGLFVVYLSTPHDDLTFYLFTSASRTMMTASVALLISMFFLLSGLEMNEPEPRHRSDPMVQSAR